MIPEIKNSSLKIFKIENFRQALTKYLIVVFLIAVCTKKTIPVNTTPICSQNNETPKLFSASHHFLNSTNDAA